jgi:outer membrane beta-barrel protein
MSRTYSIAIRLSLAFGIALATLGPDVALADRKNPLDGQPAVRHRKLLVKNRFEVTPAFESTINADYKHTVGGGLKLEFHLSDMLSFGGVGFFGASFDTGLSKKIERTLPAHGTVAPDDPDPTPTADEFSQHLNEMPFHGAVFVSVTPWYGKLAAFGKAFVPFDFYFQAGISFASLTNSCTTQVCNDNEVGVLDPMRGLPDNDPNDDPPLNDGFKAGLYLGGGIHVFVTDFIAIDLTIRDYIFSDNPSGLDFDADAAVQDDDSRFLNHIFMGVGVSVLLPTKVKRTQ